MNRKLESAFAAYQKAKKKLNDVKSALYPSGASIEVDGYGKATVLGDGGSPLTLSAQLSGGHRINVYITAIKPPKKAKVTK